MRRLILLLAGLSLSIGAIGCKKQAGETPDPHDGNGTLDGELPSPYIPTPSPPKPTPPFPPPPAQKAKLFVAPSGARIISMYTLEGNLVGHIDLAGQSEGFVTGMAWLDNNNLLAFMDPGTSGESIAKITFTSDTNYSINGDWYADPSNLSGVRVTKMFSPGFAVSPLVLIAKNSASLEAISTNSSFSRATRAGAPYISSTAACPLSTAFAVTRTTLGNRLILGSNGSQPRINVYANDKSCVSSYNFSTSYPAAAGFTITGLAASAENIFVRYQHTTTPMIAKCAFDGTNISSCEPLLNDTYLLGLNSSSREMIFDESTNSLYFPNWNLNAIMQLNAASGYAAPLIRNGFTTSVASISIRPN